MRENAVYIPGNQGISPLVEIARENGSAIWINVHQVVSIESEDGPYYTLNLASDIEYEISLQEFNSIVQRLRQLASS